MEYFVVHGSFSNAFAVLQSTRPLNPGLQATQSTLEPLLSCCVSYMVPFIDYLHTLSKLSSPNFTSITYWFEFYYDVIRGGQYPWKLKELHNQYDMFTKANELAYSRRD